MQKQGSKLPENLVKKITAKGAPPKMVSYSQAKHLNYKNKGFMFGIENEPVAADLYKEYPVSYTHLTLPTNREV